MKIALVVQGRFHAFDLARALISHGHDVTVFTNYPSWAVERFGRPAPPVRTFPVHGALARACGRMGQLNARAESWLHTMFGRWAARKLAASSWDVVHCWSGVSEELLLERRGDALTLLMRGSSHIATQRRLLEEEEARAGQSLDRPSDWMIAREQREYALADRIVVLSTFARASFEEEGVPAEKLAMLPLGVDVRAFRLPAEAIQERQRRVMSDEPLRILYVGALSCRKGIIDLGEMVELLPGGRFTFTFVGPVTPEAAGTVARLGHRVECRGSVPQGELPDIYRQADVFVFPTIEDGYGLVLAQAKAAGLPILTTPNSAAPDLITPGADGWIVPIRRAPALASRLEWCDANRTALAQMTAAIHDRFQPRDWSDVAHDFETVCERGSATRLDGELVLHG